MKYSNSPSHVASAAEGRLQTQNVRHDDTPEKSEHRPSVIRRHWDVVLVLALAIALWLPRLTGPIDLRYDAGVYYILGTSLATGHGYRIPSEPGSPQALQYPPLLAGIVAVYEKVLGSIDPAVVGSWLRKSYAIIFLAYAVAVLALAKRFLPGWLAVAAAALCLVHHQSIFLSDLLFAELPFALVTVGFALVAGNPSLSNRPWGRGIASFGLAVAAFLLRTAGLALLAAWVMEALLHRRWRVAIVRAAVVLVPVLAWQGYVREVRKSEGYAHPAYEYQRAPYQYYNVSYAENALLIDPFRPELGRVTARTVASRFLVNLPKMGEALGQTVTTTSVQWRRLLNKVQRKILRRSLVPPDAVLLPMYCFAGFVCAGVLLLALRKARLVVLLILASVALVWTTPWPAQFSRYLAPLIPFFGICFILSWSCLGAWIRAKSSGRMATLGQVLLGGFLLLAFAMEAYTAQRLFRARQLSSGVVLNAALDSHNRSESVQRPEKRYRLFAHNSTWQSWEKAALWISSHAPKDAIVATTAPHFFYLLTGHLAVLPPMESDPAQEQGLLKSVPVSYVVVDQLEFLDISRRYAKPAVENAPGWRLATAFGDTRIYERIP